jgi:two-component system phosphate regulon sensor histidine kinase PhoR
MGGTGEQAQAAPVPATRVLWDKVFPETIGLGFALVLAAGLGASGLVGFRALEAQRQMLEQRLGLIAARSLACGIEAALRAGPDPQVSSLPSPPIEGGYSFTWYGPDGRVRLEHPARAAGFRQRSGRSFRAPVHSPTGEPAGEIELHFNPLRSVSTPPGFWQEWWLTAGASLAGMYWVYRRLRRRLRPMDAVRRNLLSYANGLEQELLSLTLSDSFGQVAQAWNRLVAELAAFKRQFPQTCGQGAARDVLSKFESRTLRQVLDRLPLGVLRLNKDRTIRFANASAAEMLDRPLDGLIGQPLPEVVGGGELAAVLTEPSALTAGGVTVDRSMGKGEREAAIRLMLLPLDGAGQEGEILVTLQDISHLREAERSRDNFLYHVTHELRTPLTNIQAYAETLTKPDFDDEQTRRECYNVIISETRRLSRLIEDILSVSQLEVGTARFDLGDVDLQRLVRQTVQDNLGAADEKGIELTLKLPPKLPKLRGDKQRLAGLLMNLIGNAIKYTPRKGRVQVSLETGENSVLIHVSDNGVGIAPEDLPHIFEKFYRAAHPAVQEVPGTGLGLAIAREVVRLHGGDIRVVSEPGRGSTFTVELPCVTEPS